MIKLIGCLLFIRFIRTGANYIKSINAIRLLFLIFCSRITSGMIAQKYRCNLGLIIASSTALLPQPHIAKTLLMPIHCKFSQKPKPSQSTNPSQSHTYTPIRPLKKNLTPLYAQKDFLNRNLITRRVPFWPYLSPFYAMLINNFLTDWSFINCFISSVLFTAGMLTKLSANERRDRQILKMESTPDMRRLYVTLVKTMYTDLLAENYPQNFEGIQEGLQFTNEDLKGEYEPSQQERKSLSEEQLNIKRQQFKASLLNKILKEQKRQSAIIRIELDSSKTTFKLSQSLSEHISDAQVLHPPVQNSVKDMFDVPFKYLIIRSEFLTKRNKPVHFFIDLEENCELKYQDYLSAMGANYKIDLAKVGK